MQQLLEDGIVHLTTVVFLQKYTHLVYHAGGARGGRELPANER